MTEFNYCPKCGEELVDEAEFCHSCGVSLSEVGNNTQSKDGSEESDILDGMEADPDVTMDDIDLDDIPSQEYNELEEKVENIVEEKGLTINDVSGQQVMKALIIDKIIERSAEIKYEEAQNK